MIVLVGNHFLKCSDSESDLNVGLIELRLVNHLCEDFFVHKHFVCLIIANKVVVLFYLRKVVNNFCESLFLNGFNTGH